MATVMDITEMKVARKKNGEGQDVRERNVDTGNDGSRTIVRYETSPSAGLLINLV